MMILHHGWRSSASRRVRLCLEEKGLAYEGHVVDMANMEHHSPEYLRINPLGVIPALIHEGRPLHESGTICEYLDETFPDPPLRHDTPYQRAEMRNWIRHIDGLIGNLIIFNWRHHLQKTASQWTDAELAEKLKKIPSKERQEAWLRVARKPYTEEERDAARTKLVTLAVATRITNHAIFVAATRTLLTRNPEAELQSIGSTSRFVCCECGRAHLLGIRVVRRALNGVRALRLIFARNGGL